MNTVVVMTAAAQLLGVALTAGGAYWLDADIDRQARHRFEQQVDHLQTEIERRFTRPLYAINGARGLYEATGELTGAQFRAYVASRDLPREFPGIRGFGFVERVARTDLARFVAEQRRVQDAPNFQVRTAGGALDLYVVKHVEPMARNFAAWGMDAGVDPVRRAAIERAVDSGQPTLSPPLRLVQADPANGLGFLFLVPLYMQGTDPATPAQRRALLTGLIYAPIVVAEILQGLDAELHGLVDYVLLAGIDPASPMPVHDTRRDAASAASAPPLPPASAFRVEREVRIGGQPLLLRASTTAAFDAAIDRSSVAVVAIGGLVLSVTLALAVFLLGAGRVRAELLAQRLTRDLDRLATVARNTSNAVFVTDAQLRIVWVNEGFERITGYSHGEADGAVPKELLRCKADQPAVEQGLEAALGAHAGFRAELLSWARDGRAFWTEWDLQPQHHADGTFTGYVAIGTDTTERRRDQERLRAAMRETRALLDTLNLHAIVSVAHRFGRIVEVNDAFCRVSGYSREELIGQNHRLVNSGEHPREFWQDMWRTISSGRAWRAEVCNRGKNGRLYWVDSIVAPFLDAQGRIEKYVSIRTEITEARNAAQALLAAKQEAEAASRAKSRFLANMSHEIRTPMNAVLGMLGLLQRTPLDARQLDYARKSEDAAHSLLGLLDDILDFSKVEAGKMTLDPRPFHLDRLLRELSVILSANVGSKDIEVLYDIDPAVPRALVGDDLRLRQVLINLGGNAIKFTERGEVVVGVRLVTRGDATATVEFSVRDTGIGIAPEHQQHIFAGFSQAEASTTRRFGGTGLGLAICRRLVDMMGGELALASIEGQGSAFSFRIVLPLAQPAAQDHADERRTEGPPLHALVVDDNRTARTLLAGMARSLGWTADVADSGEQAIAMLSGRAPGEPSPYQAIFVDWRMPGLDGWETSRRLRAITQGDATPLLVMVTAHGRDRLEQRSADEQDLLDGFLVKPVTASMLFDAVVDARAAGGRARLSAPTLQARGTALAGLRILLVEDNANNRQIAQELLTLEGAQVRLAHDGAQGVEAVAAAAAGDPFDAVLMDLQMPVLDGYGATARIRGELGLHALPIIAMTANAMASDREACLAAGMDDHVGKPFDLAHLVAVLRRHTGRPVGPLPPGAPVPMASSMPGAAHDAASDADPDAIDREAALRRLGGDEGIYILAVRDFVAELAALPADLERHLAQAQTAEGARLMHTIKGLAATLGATALSRQAAEAERRLAAPPAPTPAEGATLVAAIGRAAARARAALERVSTRSSDPAACDPAASDHAVGVPAALTVLLAELSALLGNADLGAIDVHRRLVQEHAGHLGALREPLDDAMARLDFDAAQALCNDIAGGFASTTGAATTTP